MTIAHEPLGALVSIAGGGTPSKQQDAYWGGDIPWVSPKDMRSRVIEDSQDHVTEYGLANSTLKIIPPGSVLIVVRSGILARHLPLALAGRPLTVNQDLKALIPSDRVLGEYVYYYLRFRAADLLQSGVKRGATVHSLNTSVLRDLPMPVPDLESQRRVVHLLAKTDASRDIAIQLVDKLDAALGSMLGAAFQENVSAMERPGVSAQ